MGFKAQAEMADLQHLPTGGKAEDARDSVVWGSGTSREPPSQDLCFTFISSESSVGKMGMKEVSRQTGNLRTAGC